MLKIGNILLAFCLLVRSNAEDVSPSIGVDELLSEAPTPPPDTIRPKTPVQPLKVDDNDSQRWLARYKQAIEEAYTKLPRPDQAQARQQLLQSAYKTFSEYRKQASVTPRRLAQHVDRFVANLNDARYSFRFRDAEEARKLFVMEAAQIFLFEAQKASDWDTERSAQKWFEEYLEYMAQIRVAMRMYGRDVQRIYTAVNGLYKMLLHKCKKDVSDHTKDYQQNSDNIKRQFPINTEQQREQHDLPRRLLDQAAVELLRYQTK